MATYRMSRETDLPYDEAVARVRETLADEGFGILTEIDVRETLKKKLDVDFRPYVILGACNPQLAHQALSAEIDIGLLVPCNVVVYERDGGGSLITAINPEIQLGVAGRDDLGPLAASVKEKLEKAVQAA